MKNTMYISFIFRFRKTLHFKKTKKHTFPVQEMYVGFLKLFLEKFLFVQDRAPPLRPRPPPRQLPPGPRRRRPSLLTQVVRPGGGAPGPLQDGVSGEAAVRIGILPVLYLGRSSPDGNFFSSKNDAPSFFRCSQYTRWVHEFVCPNWGRQPWDTSPFSDLAYRPTVVDDTVFRHFNFIFPRVSRCGNSIFFSGTRLRPSPGPRGPWGSLDFWRTSDFF